jgi:L-alanine-DL-glutamate epimerase-like enolase superfamily enzyme
MEEIMRRRDLCSLPLLAAAPARAAAAARLTTSVRRLTLKHTWTTVMSSSDYRDTFFVEYERDGRTGTGEGAPIVRYRESAAQAKELMDGLKPWLESADPWQYTKVLGQLFQKIEGHYAAKAAVDIALLDWVSQSAGVPLWKFLGLDRRDAPLTTFSIGIDKAEVIRKKVQEAEAFPVLKIKVGLDNDEEVIAAVRGVTR